MPNLIAEKCDHCGKVVVKTWQDNSTGRVIVQGEANLLWLCDYKRPASARPSLDLHGKTLCLGCVVPFFQEWVDILKSSPEYSVPARKVRDPKTGRFAGSHCQRLSFSKSANAIPDR